MPTRGAAAAIATTATRARAMVDDVIKSVGATWPARCLHMCSAAGCTGGRNRWMHAGPSPRQVTGCTQWLASGCTPTAGDWRYSHRRCAQHGGCTSRRMLKTAGWRWHAAHRRTIQFRMAVGHNSAAKQQKACSTSYKTSPIGRHLTSCSAHPTWSPCSVRIRSSRLHSLVSIENGFLPKPNRAHQRPYLQ